MIKENQLSIHNGKLSKTKYTQNWSIGNSVKVGFLTLEVVNYDGQLYTLKSSKGLLYEFEPHKGLTKVVDKVTGV